MRKVIKANILSMNEIIGVIENSPLYKWKLLWIEAIAKDPNYPMLEFEKSVNNSVEGHFITIEELWELNEKCHQVIDILFIGDRSSENLKRYSNDEEMRDRCYYCFELIDSSFWDISTGDIKLANFIQHKGVVA